MPIYEYRCSTCGRRYEALVQLSPPEQPSCPRCGGRSGERLLSTFSVGRTERSSAGPGPCGSHECACRQADIDR